MVDINKKIIILLYLTWALIVSLLLIIIIYNQHIIHTSVLENYLPGIHNVLISLYDKLYPLIFRERL